MLHGAHVVNSTLFPQKINIPAFLALSRVPQVSVVTKTR